MTTPQRLGAVARPGQDSLQWLQIAGTDGIRALHRRVKRFAGHGMLRRAIFHDGV